MMMRILFAFAVLMAAAVAQTSPVIGTVTSVDRKQIQVLTGRQSLRFSNTGTPVALQDGDQIRIQFHRDATAGLIATQISKMVTISGQVRTNAADRMEIRTKTGVVAVQLSPGTIFSADRSLLGEGDAVYVAGWEMGEGKLDAVRVTVYNTDAPVTLVQ